MILCLNSNAGPFSRFDWMLPEAWNHEHNVLHHYRLGEVGDPDLVENNLEFVRSMTAPRAVKYAGVAFLMCTWKWFYYAPNTYKELMIREMRRRGEVLTADMEARKEFTLKYFAEPAWSRGTQYQWYTFAHFFKRVMGPYLVGRFLLLPLPLLLLGPAIAAGLSALSPLLSPHLTNWLLPSTAAASAASGAGLLFFQHAVWNLFLADVLTNIHSFVMIMPNHCGSDLYKFSTSCRPNSGTFYLRQVFIGLFVCFLHELRLVFSSAPLHLFVRTSNICTNYRCRPLPTSRRAAIGTTFSTVGSITALSITCFPTYRR